MPFQSVPGGIQCEILFRLAGQTVQNVLHFEAPLPPTLEDLEGVAGFVDSWVQANYIGPLSGAITYNGLTVKSLVNQFDFIYEFPVIPPVVGGGGGGVMPNEVALCMSLRSGLTGRSTRGRVYVPGIPSTVVTGNVINSTFTSAMLTAWNALIPLATSAGFPWCVLSRETNNTVRTTGVLFEITSVILVDDIVDSQRRRKPGNGT